MVLPVDEQVADVAATIWSQLGSRGRGALGDILIAATASVNQLPLVTRNHRDFAEIAKVKGVKLSLRDWAS